MENYGQFNLEHLHKIGPGLGLYNQQKYWECHEYLEDHWFEDMGDNARYVYWTVIQVACSLHHHRDGNTAGAAGMLAKAKDKFQRCRELGVETPLLRDHLNWETFRRLVFEIPPAASPESYQKLQAFRFPSSGMEVKYEGS